MEEKRNVTICFNSDEMYIVRYFQNKGKLSTEMKRVLKDYVDNNKNSNDLEEILDARLAKILSVVVGNGMTPMGMNSISSEMISQFNNLQNPISNSINNYDDIKEEDNKEDDEVEADSFSLPPASMLESFPFFKVNEDED